MDYSSINSELIESLDFLIPPVKRVIENRSTIHNLDSHINNINVLRDFRKDISKNNFFSQSHRLSKIKPSESSTSLILEKTTERDILQQFAVLSYTNLGSRFQDTDFPTPLPISKERPLIKVTVIPKTAQPQPSNVPKKRKHLPKRIHLTVSNQENSIQTKNVYLVVQGRKREKVYEIKTTGSAKLTTACSKQDYKDEVIPIEQLSSLKLVLDSLKMDRDREKDKRRRKMTDVNNCIEFSRVLNGNDKYCECTCWRAVKEQEKLCECTSMDEVQREITKDMANSKSRVRITGRLGLTEDDRYVLQCAATVNDKPLESANTDRQTAPFIYREERNQKKDFNIQADLQNENKWVISPMPGVMHSKESQATQVNFINDLLDVPKCRNQLMIKDEIIQCCHANVDTLANEANTDSDSNSLKDSHSPLVIISVYPMKECCENVKIIKKYQDDVKCSSPKKPNVLNYSPQRPRSRNRANNENKTDNKYFRPRSRSPSPQNKNITKDNVAETRILRTNTRKVSPGCEITPSLNKPNQPTRINLNKTKIKPKFTKNSQRHNPTQMKESKGINTEHSITKKILVDTYTKKLTDYLKSENTETKLKFPKSDPSKVTVNINGDNEYYNVLFQQANSTTDLQVRKSVKGNDNKKRAENFRNASPIMRNLLLHEEPKRRPSPVQNKNQQKDDHKVNKTFPRLQVRDSIEIISHRRDCKPPVDHTVRHNKNSQIDDDSGKFSAPIKHYRGDSCPIADPIMRDKEIRALLGVDKCVHTSAIKGLGTVENKIAVPLHYFYGNKCEKKIVTGINIMEMPEPPCVCCDIRKFYNRNSNFEIQPQLSPPQMNQSNQQKTKSIHSASPQSQSQHNKKVNATSSEIDKETAQQEPASSDSASLYERNQSPMEESPGSVDKSPRPLEETRSSVAEKVPTYKPTRKSRANSMGTQYETQVQRTSLYQQLILNRNIQVFLQVDQFSKQKPIILSRKQYDKVKRTIESTIANKTGREYKRKKCICKTSLISVGDVRRKTNPGQTLHYDKQSQTDKKELANTAKKSSSMSNRSKRSQSARKQSNTLVLFANESNNCKEQKETVMPRQAMSSMEIQYASMSYMKRVTFSSTNVEAGSKCPPPLQIKESHSIHTIFKGHKKCATPNLGTSINSLNSEDNNAMISPKPVIMAQESKQRKPLLRRLMSCLVMRSAKASELNIIINPPVNTPSISSSIDSYHISTSLGAIEMSSSIYDTSASFYSNHSTYLSSQQ